MAIDLAGAMVCSFPSFAEGLAAVMQTANSICQSLGYHNVPEAIGKGFQFSADHVRQKLSENTQYRNADRRALLESDVNWFRYVTVGGLEWGYQQIPHETWTEYKFFVHHPKSPYSRGSTLFEALSGAGFALVPDQMDEDVFQQLFKKVLVEWAGEVSEGWLSNQNDILILREESDFLVLYAPVASGRHLTKVGDVFSIWKNWEVVNADSALEALWKFAKRRPKSGSKYSAPWAEEMKYPPSVAEDPGEVVLDEVTDLDEDDERYLGASTLAKLKKGSQTLFDEEDEI